MCLGIVSIDLDMQAMEFISIQSAKKSYDPQWGNPNTIINRAMLKGPPLVDIRTPSPPV
jgi:hypothetical protein